MRIKIICKATAYYIYNSIITNIPSYTIRKLFLTRILRIKIGKESAVHMGCFFTGSNISIGNNTVINRRCYLDGRARLTIGNNTSISPETYILSLDHDAQSSQFETIQKETIIKDNVWIGVRSIILPGVTIEDGAVIGAGSVVTKKINRFEIAAGNPAKYIKMRDAEINYRIKYFPLFDTDEQLL
jgi:acetyltransferase-like isoleucine patch superfamily enzyme